MYVYKCFHTIMCVPKVFEWNQPLKAMFVHSSKYQQRVEIVKVKSLGANVTARVWEGVRGPLSLAHKAGLYRGQTDEVSGACCHWVQSNDWPSMLLPNPLIVLSMFGCGHSLTLWGVRIAHSMCVCGCVCVYVCVLMFGFLFTTDTK